ERNPRNVVRLELPEDRPGDADADNRYTRAAAQFRQWLNTGDLLREVEPALYVYGQRYQAGGMARERLGIMAALRVEPFAPGGVIPPEQSFPEPKEREH